jgi:hypothetical protein
MRTSATATIQSEVSRMCIHNSRIGFDCGNCKRKRNYTLRNRKIDSKQFLSDNARKYFNESEVQRLCEKYRKRTAK